DRVLLQRGVRILSAARKGAQGDIEHAELVEVEVLVVGAAGIEEVSVQAVAGAHEHFVFIVVLVGAVEPAHMACGAVAVVPVVADNLVCKVVFAGELYDLSIGPEGVEKLWIAAQEEGPVGLLFHPQAILSAPPQAHAAGHLSSADKTLAA